MDLDLGLPQRKRALLKIRPSDSMPLSWYCEAVQNRMRRDEPRNRRIFKRLGIRGFEGRAEGRRKAARPLVDYTLVNFLIWCHRNNVSPLTGK